MGSGFRVQGEGYMVKSLELRVRVQVLGFGVEGSWLRVTSPTAVTAATPPSRPPPPSGRCKGSGLRAKSYGSRVKG